jgi:poly(3-hydroxybutyrate) depolymerase
MGRRSKKSTGILLLAYFLITVRSGFAGDVTIIDSVHYSHVLGENRNFRVFLPPGYYEEPHKRYPVIYFFHGWSQRYFGSINTPGSDVGDGNDGDNIGNFVAVNEVIVVRPDGYNRYPHEVYDRRPYNIGPVINHRQFPVYFPELVGFIDQNYRTLPDRNHRAVSGLSMGGFMAFWIGGKYPDLVSAVGNFCGSPEFFVGPLPLQVEYRHMDMYKNYDGVNVILNYGNKDFIRAYHRDLNRVWTEVMDNYRYRIYEAAHTTAGLGDMFGYFMETFADPPGKPDRWNHIDVYPSFSLWDYSIDSDRQLPGFTIIENVDRNGFRTSVRNFLPDGELMPFVKLKVTTAPLYGKNQPYTVNVIDMMSLESSVKSIRSDDEGRLTIETGGGISEIGINKDGDIAYPGIASVEIMNEPWTVPNKEINVKIKLFNKGGRDARGVSAVMSPAGKNAAVLSKESGFGTIGINGFRESLVPFAFRVTSDSVDIQKFRLDIRDEEGNEWVDFFEVPVKGDLPEIKDFIVADGKAFTVASAGTDSVTMILGHGNGDGIVNPGESVVILIRDQGLYRRTELYTNDVFVNPNGTSIRNSDNWGRYDNVGGSNKYSVPLISSDCPPGHRIEFFASYWLPDYPDHIIRQGTITLEVTGADTTPPIIRWITVSGDNTVNVKVSDGAGISMVKATFIMTDDPERTFEVELNDDGQRGDSVAGDLVFSKMIPEAGFGLFNIEIEARDIFGNEVIYKDREVHVLY